MKNDVRFEYDPWENVWFCLISIVWVHLSHKNEKPSWVIKGHVSDCFPYQVTNPASNHPNSKSKVKSLNYYTGFLWCITFHRYRFSVKYWQHCVTWNKLLLILEFSAIFYLHRRFLVVFLSFLVCNVYMVQFTP